MAASRLLFILLFALFAGFASPVFAQQAAKLERSELQELRSRQNAKLGQVRGGTRELNIPGLSAAERQILDKHSDEIRDALAMVRAGDVETGLSVVYWVLIGCGIAAGVAIIIILILIFSV